MLGQLKTDAKSNEITAIPQLLELLELKGCIVTVDAMRCQTEIAEKIIEKGADYVLAVKANQGHLYEAVVDFSETAQRAHFRDVPFHYHEETEGGHGRIEVRRYWTTPVLTTLPQVSQWAHCHGGSRTTPWG